MQIIRREPARELDPLNRLFNSFFDTPTGTAGARAARRFTPAVDLVETEDSYVLRADLPGVSEADVDVELEDNVLTVKGERTAESAERAGGYYRLERASGAFARTLRLPDGVDGAAIAATFDKGVLEVTIPKPEQRKPQKVAIQVGEPAAAIEGES
jgi:HSP20 family protein